MTTADDLTHDRVYLVLGLEDDDRLIEALEAVVPHAQHALEALALLKVERQASLFRPIRLSLQLTWRTMDGMERTPHFLWPLVIPHSQNHRPSARVRLTSCLSLPTLSY